jgi:hypothetical protein
MKKKIRKFLIQLTANIMEHAKMRLEDTIHCNYINGGLVAAKYYKFISKEEQEEFKTKCNNANLGHGSKYEQEQMSDRIYKLILMKRRMRNKLKK